MDREMEWRAGRQRKEVPKFHAGLSYARISQLSRNCFNKSEEIFLSFLITLAVAHRETPFEKKKNRRKKTFLVADVGIPHHLPPTFISFFLFLSLSLFLPHNPATPSIFHKQETTTSLISCTFVQRNEFNNKQYQ